MGLSGLRILRGHLAPASLAVPPGLAGVAVVFATAGLGFWISRIAGTAAFGATAAAVIALAPASFIGPDVARVRASLLRRMAKP